MQTHEELAPHIEEITRALEGKVDEATVRDELERYLELGVPLADAKRNIVRQHGGGAAGGGPRTVDSLLAGDRGVDLHVKVLTKDAKEITVQGEARVIHEGFLADPTGRVPYTAWKDHGFEAGDSIQLKNVYVKEGYRNQGVEVNLGDYTEAVPAPEIHVPDELQQAPHRGGLRRIDELVAGDNGVELRVKVLTKNPKEITVQGEERTIWYGFLADPTGRVPYTAWKDHGFEAGDSIQLKNVYVKEGFQGNGVEVNVGDYAESTSADTVDVPEGLQAAPSRSAGPRTVEALVAGDNGVELHVQVLSKDAKEITVQGKQRTIWSGFLADETGRVPYTAWKDHGFEAGDSIQLKNVYVKEGYQGNGVEVNVGDYAESTSADTVDVPDHLQNVPSRAAGPRTVEELVAGDNGVELHVQVLTKNPKEITVQGEERTIWYGFLADETGQVPYTAWKDHGFEAGDPIRVRNAYVKAGYQGNGVEVNLGDYAEITEADPVDVPDDVSTAPARGVSAEVQVRDLNAGLNDVGLSGRVLEVASKTIEVQGEPREIHEGVLGDETGKVPFTDWGNHDLQAGAPVHIQGAYVKTFRNVPNLNLSEGTTVEVLADDALPPQEELARDVPRTLGELARSGGGTGVEVEGVVMQVRDTSGLIFRCPECNRVLQKRECRVHGRVEGLPDLRVKAILDDGTGAATLILNRQETEKLLGKTLDDYQEMAREAMTHEVVLDEFVDRLTFRTLRVAGNASSDDYGLMLRARTVTQVPPGDTEDAAEKLLYELQEVLG